MLLGFCRYPKDANIQRLGHRGRGYDLVSGRKQHSTMYRQGNCECNECAALDVEFNEGIFWLTIPGCY